jgi:hypothetical protein
LSDVTQSQKISHAEQGANSNIKVILRRILQKTKDLLRMTVVSAPRRSIALSKFVLCVTSVIKEVDVAIVPRDGWERRKLVLLRERLENLNIPYNVELVDFSSVSGKFREVALQNVIWWRK